MALKEPSLDEVRELAGQLGFQMCERDLVEFRDMVAGTLAMYRPLDSLPDNRPEVRYPRTPGRFPSPEEDPLHAWYVKTSIMGALEGKLAGRLRPGRRRDCGNAHPGRGRRDCGQSEL